MASGGLGSLPPPRNPVYYTFLLLLIFLLEAMVGILSYVYQEQVYKELELNLNTTFSKSYSIDADKTTAIDQMQTQFKCCGAIRFEDWEYSQWYKNLKTSSNNKVPDTCCKSVAPGCGRRDHPSNIHYSVSMGVINMFICD
uniref:Tetraspanin n=1 Tax=Timema bartmani TaxID=61472 RepID=A0A7R9FC22_9NEOP|nr:unnamed protein product [Timema bartmani]